MCGYDKYHGALELHHLNQKDKRFGISDKGYTRSWEKVRTELDKCILLCANCHREVEGGIKQLPNESLVVKRGELLETPSREKRPGNQQPSSDARSEKVQRLSRKGVARE